MIAAWSNEEIDFNVIGSAATQGMPSFANGHYFGTDDLGRDQFARTAQGTRISLMVGLVGTFIAVTLSAQSMARWRGMSAGGPIRS